MKKRFFAILIWIMPISGILLAQVGPGLGNLTYTQSDLYKSIWKYTEVNHYGSNIATMHNGYLVTTFTPDSGKPPGGLLVWDVSNPRKPVQVSRIYDSRTVTFREQHAIPQHGNYILLQDGCGFQIWDLSDPRNPKQTKRYCIPGYAHDDYGSTWQMFWQAPYIFIANGSKGFDVIDATDINNPQFVKHITTPRQIGSIYAIGNLLVTSAHDFGKGITIYDISNPRDPRLLNSFSNTENMYASMVNGNMLVISARGNANNAIFGTYDISDPLNIRKMGTLNIGNSGEQLYNSMQDEFIFQGCQSEVVKINASNPSQLTIAGRGSLGITGDSDHGQVSPFGNLIFVGNDHGSGSGFWVHQMQPDKRGPDVNMISPRSNEVNRALTSRIGITLTDYVQLETVNKNTFIVRPVGGSALSGKYSHQFAMVNFSPDQPLLPNTTYEVIIPAGGIKDYAGNTSTQTFTSYFSTGSTGNFPPGTASTPWVFEDDKQVTLNWDRISNSTGYVIKRSTSPTGPFQNIGTTTQLSYIDKNLTNETNYYYQLVGENSFGQGVPSVAVRAKPAFYITTLNYTSQTNGWGPVEIDQSNGEAAANDGNVITLNGVEYSRGLGVHAQSTVKYNLDSKYERFLCDLGVDDEAGNAGSVVFTILLDGIQIYTSGLMNVTTATKAINVNVAGGRELTLTVTQDADNGEDHASWGGARLIPKLNQAPSVAITAPGNNSPFTTLETITFTSTATDADGTISKVEFYQGTTKLGEDITSPYTYSWTNVAAGTYTITAVATDNSGNKATSVPVTIRVNVPQGPYNGTVHIIPGTIQFESYDVGGNGFAYLDNSPGSSVTPVVNFRTNEDVDIESCTDAGAGYNIGFATAGEWLEYTVNVQTGGIYAIDLRVACLGDGRTISLSMDGTNIASNVAIPNTTGWQTWQTIRLNNVSLTAGQKIMRMTVGATDYVNLNYVTFTLVPPPVATITAAGATTFCAGGSVVLNAGTGTGYTYQWKINGNDILNATASSYTATQAGSYTVTVSANSQTATSTSVAVTVNALPVATITSSGPTTFVQGGSVTLQANTGAGLSYKWFNGTSQIGTGSSYVASSTGSYTVEVTNASNCKATSSSISVTANQNQPSVITINSPVANSTVSGPITIEATVTDPDGAITKVEYLAGNTVLGTGTSSPYNFIWQNPTLGNHTITIRVTDSHGGVTTSGPVIVTSNVPLVATITAAGATTFCAGGSVVLNAGTGTGYTYQWKINGNDILNATASSYTATQAGSYTVTVSANSQTATSTSIAVTVTNLPVATITSSGPTTFVQGGSVTLQANTGAGLSYKWFNGTSQIGTGSSYVANSTGSYTVEVTNASNCKATSSPISVTANQNQPSVITINSPVANSTVSGPITIEALVSDPDGAITKVEYLAGSTVLGTSTSSPYNFIWQTPTSGSHVITVRVTDSNGGITTSSPVTVISGMTTGIHSFTQIQITVYPNPSYKEITLETEMDLTNAKITVINVLGQEIQLPSTVNVNGANIDVSSLTEGTYLLIIRQENNVIKSKISIVK